MSRSVNALAVVCGWYGALGALGFGIRTAAACSYPEPPPALLGYPEQGAVEVPTDVLPIYELYRANLTVPFELVSAAGEVIPLAVGSGGGVWYVELDPQMILLPRTRYTLRAVDADAAGEDLQVSFTTGDGPASRPEPPVAAIQHYLLESATPSSCSPHPHGTCIQFPEQEGTFVEATHFVSGEVGFDMYVYLSRTPWFTDIAGVEQSTGADCVQLRRRAPNGRFSEPVNVCRGDGPYLAIRGSEAIGCTASGITQDGRLVMTSPVAVPSIEDGDLDAEGDAADLDRRSSPLGRATCNLARGSGTPWAPPLACISLALALVFRRRN